MRRLTTPVREPPFCTLYPAHVPPLALNPDPENLPSLDPKDRFLLGDPSTNSTPFTNGAAPVSGSGTSTALPVHVPWLRKTEYISREGVQRASSFQEMCLSFALMRVGYVC